MDFLCSTSIFLIWFIVLVILLFVFRLVHKNKKKIIDVEKHMEVKVSKKPENDIKDSIQVDIQNIKTVHNCPYCGGKLV